MTVTPNLTGVADGPQPLTTPPRMRRRVKVGAIVFQALLLLALAGLVLFIIHNAMANIARMNIHTGFGFLSRPAGFDISIHLIPFRPSQSTYADAFWVALINTLVMTGISIVPATILGFLIGLARLSTNRMLSFVAHCYIELIRNMPLLLQLFYWYFTVLGSLPPPRASYSLFDAIFLNQRGLYLPGPVSDTGFAGFAVLVLIGIAAWILVPRLSFGGERQTLLSRWLGPSIALILLIVAVMTFGLPVHWETPRLTGFNFQGGWTIAPEFAALSAALSVFSAAFIAEIVRAGVLTVPKGQIEAGLALGLPRWRVYWNIVIPQAMKAITPPLGTWYIVMLKNSSLGAAIAYPDLMLVFGGTVIDQTGQPIEVMAITMATYLVLCLSLAMLANYVNRRVQTVER